MRRLTLALSSLAVAGILALSGCAANTKLTSVWSDPNFQTNSLRKLMVVGVSKNPSIRRMFEDTFVGKLKEQGVDAIASYSLIGDGGLDSTQAHAAIQQSGCDGIFVTRLVDKQTVDTYYPPTTTYVGAPGAYYGGWYGYYSMGYAYESSPGYTVQNQVLNVETNLYRVADAKLIWSALSESWLEQAASPGPEIEPFVTQLVYSLGTQKIVTKVKK